LSRLRSLLKWLLFAVVVGYVCYHGYRLWTQSDVRQRPLSAAGIRWLFAGGVVYIVSWLPSVWFWRELMRAVGGQVTFRDAARAYYCGHLGKYIPGKAMVLVIRAALVKDRGCPALLAAVTASYETLVMMGTGVAFGTALAPLLFRDWIAVHFPDLHLSPAFQTVAALVVVTVVVAGSLPLVAKLLSWIAAKAVPDSSLAREQQVAISPRMIAAGCVAFCVSWVAQGLSLGTIAHGAGDARFNIADVPLWAGAMALSTSLGFAVLFAPGGLGVREGILLAVLNSQPGMNPQAAVAVTVLSRIVSFLAELAISALLFWSIRRFPDAVQGNRAKNENSGVISGDEIRPGE
jgi:glycosyltransferase 2 family protein